ncbi:hypothetical protein, partial [Halorhodospira halochloris]|uniref:hypothetical protein n=1 Tax=Halorhodospira halochloris TaxID=1052 RepID=UPI001EE843E0
RGSGCGWASPWPYSPMAAQYGRHLEVLYLYGLRWTQPIAHLTVIEMLIFALDLTCLPVEY